MYTNANGLGNKISELKVVLASGKYKIICLTETHLRNDITDTDLYMHLCLQNFEVYREDRASSSRGGGSLIYIHHSIASNVRRLDLFSGLESVALEIKIEDYSFILICMYRSCNLSDSRNQRFIEEVQLIPNVASDKDVLIVGDINLPDVDWKSGCVKGPADTNNKKLLIQYDVLDSLVNNGVTWFLNEGFAREGWLIMFFKNLYLIKFLVILVISFCTLID